ncbi:hypothetical protein HOK51_04965 [Candidatus Woesearchaeota archaeon]|jgi:predicted transcriptional regulator|nr:hypothetical protein [Candidatus Woesearchaeota archaeon]MBT6519177.1 hypothetical protein [Candidatus Woesearchaeota archaeon]MBT7368674.1 hypothetical protein [Candidatus Woesearchaeota archaeon]
MAKPTLYGVLNDRNSINTLKILYDVEYVFKSSHFVKLSELKAKLKLFKKPFKSVELLSATGLISLDKSESDELIATLTNKGKVFFETFDHLNTVFIDKKDTSQTKAYKLEYDLSDLEKRALVLCMKVQRESSSSVPLLNLTQEMFPSDFPEDKKDQVTETCEKLQHLNLIKKECFQNINYFELTESGRRVVAEQLINYF